MQTSLTRPLWSILPGISKLQFPWRFSAIQVVAASFLAAMALSARRNGAEGLLAVEIEKKGHKKGKVKRGKGGRPAEASAMTRPSLLAMLWIGVLAAPAFVYTFDTFDIRKYKFGEEIANSDSVRRRVIEEYIPIDVQNWRELRSVPPRLPKVTLKGRGKADVVDWENHFRRIRVVASGAVDVQIRTFAFPGWVASVDGEPAAVRSDNPRRMIEVSVPEGTHELVLAYEGTFDQKVGAALSCLGFLVLLGVGTMTRRRPLFT
jgi:hypothetical protein